MFGKVKKQHDIYARLDIREDCVIAARDVSKSYQTGLSSGSVPVLTLDRFQVQRGEMVAIMGPSGCGKTTMLNCLSGLDTVDRGEIWLEGKNLAAMSDRECTRYRARRMGFIFQVYNLLPVLSAVENVELPLLVSGVPIRAARVRATEALERVGLGRWVHHRPAEMSGGQRQRVTIARALVNNPALVWADEPTGALDSTAAAEIMGLLIELNLRDGITCVIVTHDPQVGQQCSRIVTMRDGTIVPPLVLAPPIVLTNHAIPERQLVGSLN